MLEFCRCLAIGTGFAFSSQDMPTIRRRLKKEITDGRIVNETISEDDHLNRRISNFDQETCWLNACIQLLLNGLDHSPGILLESVLGKELITMQNQHFINPMYIKQMLQNEIDFNLDVLEQENILSGQHCARDLFILLTENKHNWLDVYNLFHHVVLQTVTCPFCQRISTLTSSDLYREILCPPDGSKLRNYLELLFNCEENVDYFCEEGCKKHGKFKKKLQLVSEDSSNFLLVILTRGISENVNNYKNKVIATDDIKIKDTQNVQQIYEPIAIIQHEGFFTSKGETRGHYLCDIKYHKNQNWYNTNDENIPKLLSKQNVTKYGYVILYKKK